MSQHFNKEQLSYLQQLMTNRNKSLRHEVSDHLDNALPVRKIQGIGIDPPFTKGDLIGFSADNTPVKISGSGVSNGSVLTFDSGETAEVGWRGFIGARAYNQTAGNIVYVGAGTPVAVPFASETFDTNSIHDNATNNTRMTLNKAGYWQVNYGILWLASSGYTPDGYCYGYIRKNGTGNAVGGFDIYRYEAGIGTDEPYNQGSDIVYSDGDDYIEIMAVSTAVPTYVVGAYGREDLVYCSVAWLGP